MDLSRLFWLLARGSLMAQADLAAKNLALRSALRRKPRPPVLDEGQ